MVAPNRKKQILVVDDEPDIVTYLVTLLHDNGYETLSARDGSEGMDLMKDQTPDLITLDISMPSSSGTLLYETLKADPVLKTVPVVIVTAVTNDAGDVPTFRDIMVDRQRVPEPEGYFTKPIDREEFLVTIRKLLL